MEIDQKALEDRLVKFAEKIGPLYVEDIREFFDNNPKIRYDHTGNVNDMVRTNVIEECAKVADAASRYMRAVKRLGEDSGYNRLTYFEAPISKMPTERMAKEAGDRWLELNNAGQDLTAAIRALTHGAQ